MSGESIQNMLEEEREEDDEACIDQFDNSKMIYDEEREEHNCDEPSDSKDKWEKIGLKIEGYSLCAIEAHTLAKQDMEVLKDEGKSESTMSGLDDMWYTGYKESNIQDFEDEDLVDKEDFKEEMIVHIVEGLRVSHDELKKLHDGDEEATTLVEIDLTSTPLDESNITLVKEVPRKRYTLKFQDIIGINDEMFKYSCWTNSMNNNLNFMPCSNNDHVDRLDFLENEKCETFMFEPINLTPKEPFPNDELSVMHETYASFVYTLTCCYNSHVVLIVDAYVYNKFCKSRSCFALGEANDLREEHVGKGPIVTNHVDKA
jgi:hypothetical protein